MCQPPAPVMRRGGSVRLPAGKRALVRLARALLDSLLCVLFVSSLLGPHVVCGSPVAVFFSFSLFVDCVLV